MSLIIQEHSSSKYTPRTYANAKLAGITVAFAVDFSTAGEKCTHKAAGNNYMAIPLKWNPSPLEMARKLYKYCKIKEAQTLNIAGNGIYTLVRHGWDQRRINQFVYDVLSPVTAHLPILKIISGGQTGVDMAGLVAAYKLGIPCVGTLPNGFIQRSADGVDRSYSKEQIEADIIYFSEVLK